MLVLAGGGREEGLKEEVGLCQLGVVVALTEPVRTRSKIPTTTTTTTNTRVYLSPDCLPLANHTCHMIPVLLLVVLISVFNKTIGLFAKEKIINFVCAHHLFLPASTTNPHSLRKSFGQYTSGSPHLRPPSLSRLRAVAPNKSVRNAPTPPPRRNLPAGPNLIANCSNYNLRLINTKNS